MLLVEREDVDAECEADAIDPLAVGEAPRLRRSRPESVKAARLERLRLRASSSGSSNL